MKKFLIGIVGVFTLSAMTACTPSPEKVCSHLMHLAEKDMAKHKEGEDNKEKSKERMEKGKKKCLEDLEADKKKDNKQYECAAKCLVDMKEWDQEKLSSCQNKCK